MLHGYFGIEGGDDSTRRREKVSAKLAALDLALDDTMPYVMSFLGIQGKPDPLAQMDALIKRTRTLAALKRILLHASLVQPLVVVFEDLHWIDEGSQEFLDLIADGIASARTLLLVNYRPEYSHEWSSKSYYIQLGLDPLGRESADEMLTALVGDGSDHRPVARRREGTPSNSGGDRQGVSAHPDQTPHQSYAAWDRVQQLRTRSGTSFRKAGTDALAPAAGRIHL